VVHGSLVLILFRIFILALFLGLVYAVQRFWFVKAWRSIGTLPSVTLQNVLRASLIGMAMLLLCAVLNPLFGRFLSRLGGGRTVLTFASLWLVTSLFAFLAVKSVGGVEWITNAVARLRLGTIARPVDSSRRRFFQYAAVVAGGVPFLAASYGFAAGRRRYTIHRVDVPVANLPPGLEGLRIAQLSDIHIGDYMSRAEIARAVKMANELNADLAVVTGDFVTSEGDPLDVCISELSLLRAPLGVWGCNGNHEIYAGVEDEAEHLFREKGMRLLRSRSEVIEHNGASLNLLGVDYQRDRMVAGGPAGPMLLEIEPLIRRDMPNILLSHNPNSFRRAAHLGIELSLAGHTHGGQVKVEIVDHSVNPARLITPFIAGLYRLPMSNGNALTSQKASLYVNRGLGTIGFPVRLGVPPEITLLTLRRA
jgi:predicted MPP superfamily phosphohydrolase